MSVKARWILLGLGVTLLGVFLWAAAWLFRETRPVRATLSDGSIVTLEEVVSGTNWFFHEKPIYKTARRVLPSAFDRWLTRPAQADPRIAPIP